jgi:hypothetical protein
MHRQLRWCRDPLLPWRRHTSRYRSRSFTLVEPPCRSTGRGASSLYIVSDTDTSSYASASYVVTMSTTTVVAVFGCCSHTPPQDRSVVESNTIESWIWERPRKKQRSGRLPSLLSYATIVSIKIGDTTFISLL